MHLGGIDEYQRGHLTNRVPLPQRGQEISAASSEPAANMLRSRQVLPAGAMTYGNGSVRAPHPAERFGED